MNRPRIKTAVWDVETDGLLDRLTRVHCLTIRDYERGLVHRFRSNDDEETIHEGVALLLEADFLVGHNIVAFDIPALEKVFGKLDFRGKIRDTLVLARVVFADQKDKDFRLWERGKLPGKYIGTQSLESWGHRLGLHKGDYAAERAAQAKALGITDPDEIIDFVWGTWNPEMDDYCAGDVEVTTLLWAQITRRQLDNRALQLEHMIHLIMAEQERNGWPFDIAAATALANDLEKEATRLADLARKHYGYWYAPDKKRIIFPLWDPDETQIKRKARKAGKEKKEKVYLDPRPEYGEDDSRAIWAEVSVPKKTLKYKDPARADITEGAPYCKIKRLEFNPTSRQHVVDRFVTVYDWEPVVFTDSKAPAVDDTVLLGLVDRVPMAKELSEVFYHRKRLGQIRDGKNAWLKVVAADGAIHCYTNVGGTLTGRATHVNPNLAQVPRVVIRKAELLGPDGQPIFNEDGTPKIGPRLFKGREGKHGWDCRNLFISRGDWPLVGCDLEGIELRCLAEMLRPYDGGEYIDVILTRDIHTYNQEMAGLNSRDNAKTFIYALVYGAGDVKLGSIVAPGEKEDEQRDLGAKLRMQFLANLKGFKQVMNQIKRWANGGFIPGLDGRRLPVRSAHSALNTKLQSDAALIAKQWIVNYYDTLVYDYEFVHGWEGDFAFLAWIHDETQVACKPEHVDTLKLVSVESAAQAGKMFGFHIPVAASPKSGFTWAQTH